MKTIHSQAVRLNSFWGFQLRNIDLADRFAGWPVVLIVLTSLFLSGCDAGFEEAKPEKEELQAVAAEDIEETAEKTEADFEIAAREFFEAEFEKWILGKENEVTTLRARKLKLAPPISHDVRTVIPDEGDPRYAVNEDGEFYENWKERMSWPSYRFNVAIEWESQSGTPLVKITAYTLSWHDYEKRWHAQEFFQ